MIQNIIYHSFCAIRRIIYFDELRIYFKMLKIPLLHKVRYDKQSSKIRPQLEFRGDPKRIISTNEIKSII